MKIKQISLTPQTFEFNPFGSFADEKLVDVRLEAVMSAEEATEIQNALWNNLGDVTLTTKNDHIKAIYVDEEKKTVAVRFRDGTVQKSKCAPEDEFDVEVGVALCIAMKQFKSKTEFKNLVRKKTKRVKKPTKELVEKVVQKLNNGEYKHG